MVSKKISYKMNVGIYFFIATMLLVLLITSAFYYFARKQLYSEIIENLKSTVAIGADTIDSDAFKRVSAKLSSKNLSPQEIADVESSADFVNISKQLNKIRDSKNGLILYVYTLVPTTDLNNARFVVDADLINDKINKITPDEISEFGKLYDITAQPVTQKALSDKLNVVDPKYVYDKQYSSNSIMGFAPIYDKNNHEYLGTLGADISDKNIATFLNKLLITSTFIAITSIMLIIGMTLFLAGSVSKPITSLSEIVYRFSKKEFDARASFDTHIREISDLIDNFNCMAQTIQNYNKYLILLNSSYERFVPVEFLGFLSKENIIEVKLGDQIQKDMAVMFSDIRSFSTLSEAMTPKQTFDFLNSYLLNVSPIIREHSGFVDKYLGDGVMALFPKKPDDAILAAIGICKELTKYNEIRATEGLIEIKSGIGIHLGTLMLGTIGDERRMQGTVISDSVNLASRLENLTKNFGVSILISKEIFSRIENPEIYKYRFLGNTNVTGKSESVAIFEIYDAERKDIVELKDITKREFENGIYYFGIEDYKSAEAQFAEVLLKYPTDKASLFYIEKCRDNLLKSSKTV